MTLMDRIFGRRQNSSSTITSAEIARVSELAVELRIHSAALRRVADDLADAHEIDIRTQQPKAEELVIDE